MKPLDIYGFSISYLSFHIAKTYQRLLLHTLIKVWYVKRNGTPQGSFTLTKVNRIHVKYYLKDRKCCLLYLLDDFWVVYLLTFYKSWKKLVWLYLLTQQHVKSLISFLHPTSHSRLHIDIGTPGRSGPGHIIPVLSSQRRWLSSHEPTTAYSYCFLAAS